MRKIFKTMFRLFLKTVMWLLFIVFSVIIILVITNIALPKQSKYENHLDSIQKIYIAEYQNLQRKIGESVWPRWGAKNTPVIVYNEYYIFLISYDNPPKGWIKVPQNIQLGIDWEVVDNDIFFGETYYRQKISNINIVPQNFTVKVGDKWVGSLQTYEYSAVAFYNGFKKELPSILKPIFPYRFFWKMIMGTPEDYISALSHEAFHAFQGENNENKFNNAEFSNAQTDLYPWNNQSNIEGWKDEAKFLMLAYETSNDSLSRLYLNNFLKARDNRRRLAEISDKEALYEKQREWLEGTAKYSELKIGINAALSNDYSPFSSVINLKNFYNYEKRNDFFYKQLAEVSRNIERQDENKFYYSGLIQSLILDRFDKSWKSKALEDDIYLEDLIRMIE
jgi:hypothetical protein